MKNGKAPKRSERVSLGNLTGTVVSATRHQIVILFDDGGYAILPPNCKTRPKK